MAAFYWNPRHMTRPLVLPAAVAEDSLQLAGAEQLRVLLWLSRQQLQWDAAACAADLNMPPDECDGCLRFWTEQGILLPASDAGTADDTPPAAAAKAAAIPRPAAVKPLLQEVLAYQKTHPAFSTLVEAASSRLGKPLSHGDTATLLYLLDTVGLPMEVILTEIAYAVSIGKPHMRYIEKMALDWADKELTTLAAVDEHIRYLERCRRAGTRLETMLSLPRPLTGTQAQTAEKWLEQWQVREEMLQKAADIAREKTGKLNFPYMDRILERWRAEGIDSPDKIPAPVSAPRKKGAAATNPAQSSLDTDGFDQELLRYRPTYGSR